MIKLIQDIKQPAGTTNKELASLTRGIPGTWQFGAVYADHCPLLHVEVAVPPICPPGHDFVQIVLLGRRPLAPTFLLHSQPFPEERRLESQPVGAAAQEKGIKKKDNG